MNDIVKDLRNWGGSFGAKAADEIERLRKELAALKAQEPVAWRIMHVTGAWLFRDTESVPLHGEWIGQIQPLYTAPVPSAEVGRDAALVSAYKAAVDSLVDFGTNVGGSSSYWEEVWPNYEAAIDAAMKGSE